MKLYMPSLQYHESREDTSDNYTFSNFRERCRYSAASWRNWFNSSSKVAIFPCRTDISYMIHNVYCVKGSSNHALGETEKKKVQRKGYIIDGFPAELASETNVK